MAAVIFFLIFSLLYSSSFFAICLFGILSKFLDSNVWLLLISFIWHCLVQLVLPEAMKCFTQRSFFFYYFCLFNHPLCNLSSACIGFVLLYLSLSFTFLIFNTCFHVFWLSSFLVHYLFFVFLIKLLTVIKSKGAEVGCMKIVLHQSSNMVRLICLFWKPLLEIPVFTWT